MITLTVGGGGEVDLSSEILEHLGVHAGDNLLVDQFPDGSIQLSAKRRRGSHSGPATYDDDQ